MKLLEDSGPPAQELTFRPEKVAAALEGGVLAVEAGEAAGQQGFGIRIEELEVVTSTWAAVKISAGKVSPGRDGSLRWSKFAGTLQL